MSLLKNIEVTEELCKFCKWTHFGTVEVNTRFGNLCEGRNCENAYKHKKYVEQCEIEKNKEDSTR